MKTKIYAKKTLSVFLAVMMLMSAWVFVAPEKAEAAGEQYYIEVIWNANRTGQKDALADDGKDSGSCIGFFIKTKDNHGTGSEETYTADLRGQTTNTELTWKKTVTGFPTSIIAIVDHGSAVQDAILEIKSIKIGKDSSTLVPVFNGIIYLNSSTKFKRFQYNVGNTWASNDSDYSKLTRQNTATWAYPEVSAVVSNPTAQTITVPKAGTASKTFTATFKDQYGVTMAGEGATAAFDPALTGPTVTMSGNTATVAAGLSVFDNLTNYDTSTGKGTRTLKITNNNVVASCTVTFQSPQLNLKFNNFSGKTVYEDDLYYGSEVNCGTIGESIGNTAPTYYDESLHDTYIWSTDTIKLTGDTVINEQKVSPSQSHTFGTPVDVSDTYHEITCTVCGYAKQVAHVYDTEVVTTDPTCESEGVKTLTCSGCNGTKTEPVPALGHNFTSGIYKEKEAGKDGTHYQKCIRCDKYGMVVTVDNCEKHTWKEESRVDATCEADGSITYKCTVCASTSYVVTLESSGHNVSKTEAHAPTKCGEIGWIEFWQCSTCGKAWSDEAKTTVINSADTNNNGRPDGAEYVNAHEFTGACQAKTTGTADSLHYYKCEYCNAYGYDGVENAGITHTWDEGSITKAATCTAEGEKTYECTAKGCNGSYTEAVAKLPHTMTKIEAVAATCLVAGNNEYYHCSVCNKYYKDAEGKTATTVEAEVVKALGHTFAEGNTDTENPDSDRKISDATCQSPAVYQVTCDRCNTQATATYTYGGADTVSGHSFGGAAIENEDGTHSYKCQIEGCDKLGNKTNCTYKVTKDVASTCITQGYTTHTCEDCGHGYTEKKALDAANHEGDTEVRNAKAATCATNGYTGDTYCIACDAKLSEGEAITADPTKYAHENMQSFAKVESTCQTAGHKAYKYCDKCGTYGTAKENLALKPHQYTTYISNGDGTHTATCDTCDSTVATPATDTQNCSGGTANCVDKAVCTVCHAEYGELDSTNHKDVEFKDKVDSTCQKEGHEAYEHCDACDSDLGEITVIEKKDHVWGSWTKVEGVDEHTRACTTCDATVAEITTETEACSGGTANCVDKAKCSVCKSAYGNVDPANHKTTANTLKNAVAATCVAPGYTGDYHYNCCDEIKENGKEIPQLAHSYTVEVEGSRKPATCIAEGEVTFSCATCPEGTTPATNEVILPVDKTNHASTEEITVGYKAATCTQEGYTGDVYHACCYNSDPGADNKYALISRGSKIEANGQHVLGTAVPEYMLAKDSEGKAVIITDEEGNKIFDVKAAEPSYAEKIAARHEDSKWYHAQICSECGEVVYSACYTYEHTYNCQDTDICEVCKGLCSLINENLHPDGLTLVPGKPATCQEDGVKAYYICEYCGKTYLDAAGNVEFDPESEEGKEQLVISKDSAPCTIDWDNPVEIVEGTCGTEGYKVYRCTEEGCTKDDIIVSTGLATNKHTWNTEAEIITQPGCGSLGYKAIKCSVCGSIKPNSYETIPATGEHDYVLIDTKEGTSCTDPSIETYECSRCGDTYETESTEGVSAHTWGEWETIGGDCATGVVQIRTCSVCGTQEQQVITTVDHDLIVKVRVEATCEEEGYITYVCKNCGYEETEIIPVDPTIEGHVLNTDYYVTVEKATCENAEMREYTCLLCGEKVVKAYGEMLDHVWLLQTEEIATCETAGHSAYYRCVRCLAELNEGDVIKEIYPALGHNDADNDGKCDECNKVLYEDGTVKCGCLCHKEGWLMQFIYKIVNFFWKLFKINPSCACGNVHY